MNGDKVQVIRITKYIYTGGIIWYIMNIRYIQRISRKRDREFQVDRMLFTTYLRSTYLFTWLVEEVNRLPIWYIIPFKSMLEIRTYKESLNFRNWYNRPQVEVTTWSSKYCIWTKRGISSLVENDLIKNGWCNRFYPFRLLCVTIRPF